MTVTSVYFLNLILIVTALGWEARWQQECWIQIVQYFGVSMDMNCPNSFPVVLSDFSIYTWTCKTPLNLL